MKIWQILLISSVILFLAGCRKDVIARDIPPQIITKWITYDCGVPPSVDKVDFKPVVWEIIEGKFTLTSNMYANLGDNMTLIKQGTSQIMKIVGFYQACIDAAQKTARGKSG